MPEKILTIIDARYMMRDAFQFNKSCIPPYSITFEIVKLQGSTYNADR